MRFFSGQIVISNDSVTKCVKTNALWIINKRLINIFLLFKEHFDTDVWISATVCHSILKISFLYDENPDENEAKLRTMPSEIRTDRLTERKLVTPWVSRVSLSYHFTFSPLYIQVNIGDIYRESREQRKSVGEEYEEWENWEVDSHN